MTGSDTLIAEFEQLAEASGGTDRLRAFVLDLAVRGQLTRRDPQDPPAADLLAEINRRRQYRRKVVEIDVEDLATPLAAIPTHWVWTVIDQVAADDENAITDGPFGAQLKTEHYVQSPGYRVIRLQNIGPGVFRDEPVYIDKARFDRLSKHHVRAGDLVVAGLVDPNVRSCQVPKDIGPAIVKADCYRFSVHPAISARFALHYLNSRTAQEYAAAHHHGMTLTRIGLGNFRRLPFPLPPAAEQHRIVSTIEEFLALCDQFDAARGERDRQRDRFTIATLGRLTEPKSEPLSFARHATFALENIGALTINSAQIRYLRQAVFAMAVRGRLVKQDPNDEPMAVTLRRRGIPFMAVGPHELPSSWTWVAVGDVASARLGKMLDNAKNRGTPRFYLRNVNVRWFGFDLSDLLQMRFEDEELDEYSLRRGDVLVCEGGEPGRAAVWDARRDDVYFQKAIHRLRSSDVLDPHFFVFALRASADDGRLSDAFTGIGIKHLTGRGLKAYAFPLPPMREQRRIVMRIDELLMLCDCLQTSLDEADAHRASVLKAALEEALAVGKERKMTVR